jgi:hypothetical protein
MILTEPVGFCLKKRKTDNRIYVYIYVTLLTDINQRRLVSHNVKFSHKEGKGILGNMISEANDAGVQSVDSNPILIHPYAITVNDDIDAFDQTKDLDLRSPLADCKPSLLNNASCDHFATTKYVAKMLENSREIIDFLKDISGKDHITEIFPNHPSDGELRRIPATLYGVVIFINFCDFMNKRYNDFKSLNSYKHLFHDLNKLIIERSLENMVSAHFATSCNIMYTCRLMFRYLCPSLGIMIAEGNGRNYSACLAYCRCQNMNQFLNKPIDVDKALPFPNFAFISAHISCDFVIHMHDPDRVSTHPYSEGIKNGYKQLSVRSYNDSKASLNLTCHEFADQYFPRDTDEHYNLNTPFEIALKWPLNFKMDVENFLKTNNKKGGEKVRSKPQRGDDENDANVVKGSDKDIPKNMIVFMYSRWMYYKKEYFFAELLKKDDIMRYIKPDYRRFEEKWRDLYPEETTLEGAYLKHFLEESTDNPTRKIFAKMNMSKMLSIYLCGLVVNPKVEHSELSSDVNTLVKTNGLNRADILPDENYETALWCPWKKTNDAESIDVFVSYQVR